MIAHNFHMFKARNDLKMRFYKLICAAKAKQHTNAANVPQKSEKQHDSQTKIHALALAIIKLEFRKKVKKDLKPNFWH